MALPRTPSLRLDGRRALVTGGTRGIGLGAAVALAEAGAAVTIVARTGVDAVVTDCLEAGLTVEGRELDVTDRPRMAALIGYAEPFDILVNGAGMARHAPFTEIVEEDYRAVTELNLAATLFVSQAVARRLIEAGKPGSIISISSQMGHVSGPTRGVYSATKFAVEGLTRAMAIELGPHNIRANTICPTFVETAMTTRNLADEQFRAWVMGKIKLGRLAQVEDVMGAVVFLASDAAAMITGSALMVDGGWTAE